MKYNLSCKVVGGFYHHCVKKEMKANGVSKAAIKGVKKEYKAVMLRAKDIGKSPLITSYMMAAYFIAMNRNTQKTAEENLKYLTDGMMKSKLFHKAMGTADTYFADKKNEWRKEWAKKSQQRECENDWVLDVLFGTKGKDDFEVGYDYHECGVCKLCKDEGCFEWAKYLCRMDYDMAEMMNMNLKRTKTLAEGGDFCDFRYSRKEEQK